MDKTNQPQLPRTGFLRLPQVLELIPISKSSWWAGVKRGLYPQSVKLGERITVWRVADIQELIQKTEASQNSGVANE